MALLIVTDKSRFFWSGCLLVEVDAVLPDHSGFVLGGWRIKGRRIQAQVGRPLDVYNDRGVHMILQTVQEVIELH